MKDIALIAAAMLAVLGLWRIFELSAARLLYPRRVRERIHVAVIAEEGEELSEVRAYAGYLYRHGKIYSKRLIILPKYDIIDFNENPPSFDADGMK